MVDRRWWLAAASSLAAGLFALPGRAAAGVFRRGRCDAPPPCPAPEPSCPLPAQPFHRLTVVGCTPYFNYGPQATNISPRYTNVRADGGVTVISEFKEVVSLYVVLTLTPDDDSFSPMFSDHLPLTQVGTTNNYTWDVNGTIPYQFQNVPAPTPPQTSYGATITAQAYHTSDNSTCGSSRSAPIVIMS